MKKMVFPWIEVNKRSFIRCYAPRCDNGVDMIGKWIVHTMGVATDWWIARYIDRDNDMKLVELGKFRSQELAKEACDQYLRDLKWRFIADRVMVLA